MFKISVQNIFGFTLIEMIVSLAIFAIVVTTSVGALLVLISTNQQLQAEQTVITNLSFALDTMTREIRTGYNYNCVASPTDDVFNGPGHEDLGTKTKDCLGGREGANFQGVSFFEGGESLTKNVSGDSDRILYFYDSAAQAIFRRLGDDPPQAITSAGLAITDMDFFVSGSDIDTVQPTVTVYIEAKEKDDLDAKIYHLQSTVTQRILDI